MKQRPARRSKRSSRPVLQPLESRQMLSVTLPIASPEISLTPLATSSSVVGYTPTQIKTAYGFSSLSFSSGKTAANGSGQTIAIVDAYNDPDIGSDLSKFDSQFGLSSASLSVVNEKGGTSLPQSNAGWAEEISLDVEWAHAIAPGAKLLLVEASSDSESDLLAGVNYAKTVGGVSVVTMSWGSSEFSGETSDDSDFTTPSGHTGVTFVAASGDDGSAGGVDWPASSPEVLSVGGTSLTLTSSGAYSAESGWSDSGGGASQYEGEPSYQTTAQSSDTRTVPDVSYDANPQTGVAVYDSYDTSTAWMEFGGTSAAAPQWGALVAIADQGRVISGLSELDGATNLLPTIYSLGSSSGTYSTDFHDITSGSTSRSVSAAVGYDEVTGLGTPKANELVPALVASTRKVTLTQTALPTRTRMQPPPPPWWMAVTASPAAPANGAAVPSTQTAAVAAAAVAPATVAVSVQSLNVQSTATPTVNAGSADAPTLTAVAFTAGTADAVTSGSADDGFAGADPLGLNQKAADAVMPLGLVGANMLATAEAAGSFAFMEATSFARTLAANSWPAGTTELRMAAESFARQLADGASRAVKPVALAAAAAGILYAVAGQAKKSKEESPLFSDRTITVG